MACMADYDEDCKGKKPPGCCCGKCCIEYVENLENTNLIEDCMTNEDMKFLEFPDIKITYGINNKKEYFESDKIYTYFRKKNLKEIIRSKGEHK